MKKISYILTSIILLINITACAGYKPIFGASNLDFKIVDYSISGDKKLGNQIYSKLYNFSKSNEDNPEAKKIYLLINSSQNVNATAKNSSGKILGYRINLSTSITAKDLMTGNEILSETFSYSSTYKAQDEFFETRKLENQTRENLIETTYQDLLIKLSERLI
tara:strand:+ start:336 stop:824 length:489 start_codon:yes stop_codon:yes gene_type:complete